MNHSDSERIAVLLQKQGHKPAKTTEAADLIVLNACSVRQSAMHRMYAKINKYRQDKKIILTGCVIEADKNRFKDKAYQIWHPNKYFQCQSVRERTSDYSKNTKNTAYIPIMTGCDNFCSYCVVPYTRGREKSRPADEIVKEAKSLIKKGCTEIMLLGQNVNSYCGSNRNLSSEALTKEDELINFPHLLRLIDSLPGNFTIKFLSSHPKDMSNELIGTIADCEKVSKEIHLPVQSGDNTILRKMNRNYTVTHYKKLIKKIRQKMPEAIISTDVIVGFPGETKKQFDNTVKLFKEIKFEKAYVAEYSPRPGTAAYKLKDNVPVAEKKRRWKTLNDIVNRKNNANKRRKI